MIYENKIIDMDFLKTNKLLSSTYTNNFNITGITFINCNFIGCSKIEYYFKYCALSNCTFYSPLTLYIDGSCMADNIVIIDNSDQKRYMHVIINTICTNVTLDSCKFYRCDIKALDDNVKFVNCVNEPRFYINKKSFYGYKCDMVANLIILEIPENAVVYESNNRYLDKCRTDKVKVLSILNTDGTYSGIKECSSWYNKNFKYKMGEDIEEHLSRVYAECTRGIHFFKHPEEAYRFYIINSGIISI